MTVTYGVANKDNINTRVDPCEFNQPLHPTNSISLRLDVVVPFNGRSHFANMVLPFNLTGHLTHLLNFI